MKHLAVLLTLLLVLVLGVAQVQLACAAGNITFVGYQFSASKIYQGATDAYVELEVGNNGDNEVTLHGASVTFRNWTGIGEYIIGSKRSGELFDLQLTLEATTSYKFRIFFDVPTSVSAGIHLFAFGVFFDSYDGSAWAFNQTWSYTPPGQFLDPWKVHDINEKTYNDLRPTVESKVEAATGAGFFSPEARSLLQRAMDSLDSADSYAAEGKWDYAVGQLQGARYSVDLAYGAEQSFRNLLIIALIVAVVALVGLGLFIRQRRKHSSKSRAKAEK